MSETRTVNSVFQIRDECNRLLEKTSDIELVDITVSANTLKEKLNELLTAYDANPEDSNKLSLLKVEVERNAINLEYFLSARFGYWKERYTARALASTLIEDVSKILRDVSKKNKAGQVAESDVVCWASYATWATKYYGRSQHILFESTPEDVETLKTISAAINKYRKDYNENHGRV